MKTTRKFLIAATAALLTVPAFGGVIVTDLCCGGPTGTVGGWRAVTWTQTSTFTGVTIGANLTTENGLSTSTGTAYLMTQLGAGTTAVDEVTTPFDISVTGNPGSNTMTNLFTGLTLGPGTYYLLIDPTKTNTIDSLEWDISEPPLQTLGTGVTQGLDVILSGSIAAFPPASSYVTNGSELIFSVTGTVGVNSPTPEPSTTGMLLSAMVAAGIMRWKRALAGVTGRRA